MSKIHHDSASYRILKFLYGITDIRESDLRIILSIYYKNFNRDSAGIAFQRLIEEGYIKKDERIESSDPLYRITKTGRDFLMEQETDPYFIQTEKNSLILLQSLDGPFRKGDTKRRERHLTSRFIEGLFYAFGVPVMPWQKPSFATLLAKLGKDQNVKPQWGYQDDLSEAECKAMLQKGLFYSLKEYLEGVEAIVPGLGDTIIGTKIYGIFLSDRVCYPVYAPKRHDNRIIKVYEKGERGLVFSLKEMLVDITRIYRPVPEWYGADCSFRGDRGLIGDKQFYNEPYALILCDGEKITYSTSTGDTSGKVSKESFLLKHGHPGLVPAGIYPISSNAQSEGFLTAESHYYQKIYVVPATLSYGLDSLKYLLTHTMEDLFEEYRALVQNDPANFRIGKESLQGFSAYDQSGEILRPLTFMPVFEARELYAIARSETCPTVLTYTNWISCISHSIKKDVRYYDIAALRFFDKDCTFIYDIYGNITGERMLDDYLKGRGLTFDKVKEMRELPRRFERTREQFYNAIARGEVKPETLFPAVETKAYLPPEKQKKNGSTVLTVRISKDLKQRCKEEAKKQGITMSKLIKQNLSDNLL